MLFIYSKILFFFSIFVLYTGLTHSEQTKIMQRFNAGDIRVLICTPEAAGEGLDIEMCNLVINYNYMRNEISSVQTKGIKI